MRIRTTIVAGVLFALLASAPALAQQRHVVDPAAMREAVAREAVTDQDNRDAVLNVLHRPQVRELADRLGLSLTRADTAVSALSSTELARIATSARTAEVQLAGGSDKIVLSVTTLLLIIIVVLLVAR